MRRASCREPAPPRWSRPRCRSRPRPFARAPTGTALGVWGALAGLASAFGVFLRGVLSQEAGWRWVFVVNLPVCAIILVAAFRLIPGEHHRARLVNFDALGAFLATAGMLLLVYAAVGTPLMSAGARPARLASSPTQRSYSPPLPSTSCGTATPLFPLSIFRINGTRRRGRGDGDRDGWLLLDVLLHHAVHAERAALLADRGSSAAYLPATFGVAISAGVVYASCSHAIGTRPVASRPAEHPAGASTWLLAHPGAWLLHDRPAPGTADRVASLGAVFVARQAAWSRRPTRQGRTRAALINASTWLHGGALGLAIFSAHSTGRIRNLLAVHATQPVALTGGFRRALLAASTLLQRRSSPLRAANCRGQPETVPDFAEPLLIRRHLEPSTGRRAHKAAVGRSH